MDFIQARGILNRVEAFIEREQLLRVDQKVLVGVSGGADSIVMLHMLLALDYKCIVAHMNFGLRGSASDEDELFVKEFCLRHECEFVSKRVDTKKHAFDKSISIEMAARELRYAWFDSFIRDGKADLLAVGHHLNDSIETTFLNLSRITGVRGVSGISPKRDKLFRPLLCLSKDEVLQYAKENRLAYRIDESNKDIIYKRNLIRHQVIPKFEILEPAFVSNMNKTLSYLRDTSDMLEDFASQWKEQNLVKEDAVWHISFKTVFNKSYGRLLLYEALKDFGFKNNQVLLIYEAGRNEPGRKFYSDNYVVYVDRCSWHIVDKNVESERPLYLIIDTVPFELSISDTRLELLKEKKADSFVFSKVNSEVAFDFDKITFPLIVRKWKLGDWFIPFGMNGRKKISDFLIDSKVSLLDKSNVYVLESGGNVVWIIGYRLDNRFRIDSSTLNVIRARYE